MQPTYLPDSGPQGRSGDSEGYPDCRHGLHGRDGEGAWHARPPPRMECCQYHKLCTLVVDLLVRTHRSRRLRRQLQPSLLRQPAPLQCARPMPNAIARRDYVLATRKVLSSQHDEPRSAWDCRLLHHQRQHLRRRPQPPRPPRLPPPSALRCLSPLLAPMLELLAPGTAPNVCLLRSGLCCCSLYILAGLVLAALMPSTSRGPCACPMRAYQRDGAHVWCAGLRQRPPPPPAAPQMRTARPPRSWPPAPHSRARCRRCVHQAVV